MFRLITRFIKHVEFDFKLWQLYKRISNIFFLKWTKTSELGFQVIRKESLQVSEQLKKRLAYYEFDHIEKIFKMQISGNERHLKRCLIDMGFGVNCVCNYSKKSDFSAIINLDEPKVLKILREFINFIFRKTFPFLHIVFPGIGRARLHLRFYKDEERGFWYATAHVDDTNFLFPSLFKFKRMFKTHIMDSIDSDYLRGTEMFNEMLLSYCKYSN